MPIIGPILAELDHEAQTTIRVLQRVRDEHLDWKPHEKSMTLRRLAWHIATVPRRVQEMLAQPTFDFATGQVFEKPENAAQIVAGYQENLAAIRADLAPMDDEALKVKVTLASGGAHMMTLSKIALVRNILMNHTYHHRGQLSVYLRLLDVPVPPIYGSTADEKV